MNFNIAIASVKDSDHRIHLWYMSKYDAINIMNNSNLNEKSRSLWFFSLYIKWLKKLLTIQNRAKKYYEDNTKVLTEKARNTDNYLEKKI